MTTSHRALDVYLASNPALMGLLQAEAAHVKRFPDYSYITLPAFAEPPFGMNVNLTIDNRLIGLHASGKSGRYLEDRRIALEIVLPEIKGTFIQGNRWRDGSFRIGYKLEEVAKKQPDDVKMVLIYNCIVALSKGASSFEMFFSKRDVSRDRLHEPNSPIAA